jgi:hypothetical protein
MFESSEAAKEAKAELAAAKAKAKALRPWYQKKRFIIPLVFILILVFSNAFNAGSPSQSPSPVSDTNNQVPIEEDQLTETVNQKNARQKAEQYLDYSAFSRQGLIQQLEYEGFSAIDAEYGTDAINADWREQAALKAKQYLEYSSFSRQGLIDQLLYEGFTQKQAEYGVSTTGLK